MAQRVHRYQCSLPAGAIEVHAATRIEARAAIKRLAGIPRRGRLPAGLVILVDGGRKPKRRRRWRRKQKPWTGGPLTYRPRTDPVTS